MYVVGLEEMVDLTATTVVLEAQSQKRAGVWLEMVTNALNRGAKNDVLFPPSENVGIHLCGRGASDSRGRVLVRVHPQVSPSASAGCDE